MKDGQIEKHEKEVYDALYKYFDKIIVESGCLDAVMEMGVIQSDGEGKKWVFEQEETYGVFMFILGNVEVFATPYYEYSEGIAYAIYKDGELLVEGTLPLVVTCNSMTDFEVYVGLVDDLIELHNL